MRRRVHFPLVARRQVISSSPHQMHSGINEPCARDLLRCTTALAARHAATTSKRISVAHSLYILCTEVTHGAENNMKIEGWQDRLPPVLGAMCNAFLLDKHGLGLSNLALVSQRSRVDRDPVARFGSVIDQIHANIENGIRDRRIAQHHCPDSPHINEYIAAVLESETGGQRQLSWPAH